MYVEGLGLWSIFIASSSYESILSKISLGYSSTRRSEGTRLLLEYAQPPYSSTGNQGAGAARWDQYAPHARDPPDKHNFFMTDLSIIAKLRTRLEFARSNPDPLWESLLQTANAKHELVCVCGGGGVHVSVAYFYEKNRNNLLFSRTQSLSQNRCHWGRKDEEVFTKH